MKIDLNYLPKNKQMELAKVVDIAKDTIPAEMIILFGSYALDNWVEEKYDEVHYKYQSDFDILVIVDNRSESAQAKFESKLEEKIDKREDIKTPVSIIVEDIQFVNKRLSKAQYFFTDIKKEGVLLFDSGKFELKEARELSNKERYRLAKQDFEYWMHSVNEFWIDFNYIFNRGSYCNAAFMLHQVTERLYSTILLVLTHYKPNTHDLAILRKMTNSLDNRLIRIFPLDTPENKRLFKLLRKAYVEARYKPSYTITQDELLQLSRQVEELKELGNLICIEKMNSFLKESDC